MDKTRPGKKPDFQKLGKLWRKEKDKSL